MKENLSRIKKLAGLTNQVVSEIDLSRRGFFKGVGAAAAAAATAKLPAGISQEVVKEIASIPADKLTKINVLIKELGLSQFFALDRYNESEVTGMTPTPFDLATPEELVALKNKIETQILPKWRRAGYPGSWADLLYDIYYNEDDIDNGFGAHYENENGTNFNAISDALGTEIKSIKLLKQLGIVRDKPEPGEKTKYGYDHYETYEQERQAAKFFNDPDVRKVVEFLKSKNPGSIPPPREFSKSEGIGLSFEGGKLESWHWNKVFDGEQWVPYNQGSVNSEKIKIPTPSLKNAIVNTVSDQKATDLASSLLRYASAMSAKMKDLIKDKDTDSGQDSDSSAEPLALPDYSNEKPVSNFDTKPKDLDYVDRDEKEIDDLKRLSGVKKP